MNEMPTYTRCTIGIMNIVCMCISFLLAFLFCFGEAIHSVRHCQCIITDESHTQNFRTRFCSLKITYYFRFWLKNKPHHPFTTLFKILCLWSTWYRWFLALHDFWWTGECIFLCWLKMFASHFSCWSW